MLYKYFSFNENSLSCLIHNEIWASNPREFNDPFDSQMTIDFNNEKHQSIFGEYVQKKAVCCFSRNYKSILMWSHYADHHKGFCIGINDPNLEGSDLVSSVNYSDCFLEEDIDAFLTSHEKGKINKHWEKLLTQKYIDWKYECEVRLILNLEDSSLKGRLFGLSDGAIKEIYFGCRMPDKKKEAIRKIMKEKAVKFYDMKKSDNDFSLEKM